MERIQDQMSLWLMKVRRNWAVVAATTKIETRKLSEWQGWTGDNEGPRVLDQCSIVVPLTSV